MNKRNFFILGIILFNLALFSVVLISIKRDECEPSNTIRVGIYADTPPFAYFRSCQAIGVDLEIVKEISKRLAKNCSLKIVPLHSIFQFLFANQIDIAMGALEKTKKRCSRALFSDAYFTQDQFIFLVPKSENPITKVEQLKGKKVIVCEYHSLIEKLKKILRKKGIHHREEVCSPDKVHFFRVLTPELGFVALKNRFGDVLFIAESAANFLFDFYGKENFRVSKPLNIETSYRIAVSQKNKELLKKINLILHEMTTDGTIKKIIENHQMREKND